MIEDFSNDSSGKEFNKAVRLVDEYLESEFGHGINLGYCKFDDIGILYQVEEIEDDVLELYASIDLINYNINFSVRGSEGELNERWEYGSLQKLIEELEDIYFEEVYGVLSSLQDDYTAQYTDLSDFGPE